MSKRLRTWAVLLFALGCDAGEATPGGAAPMPIVQPEHARVGAPGDARPSVPGQREPAAQEDDPKLSSIAVPHPERPPDSTPEISASPPQQTARTRSLGGPWVALEGATLERHRNNDGDSFHVSHLGERYEFRLYFVDTPESKSKRYRDGNTNAKRIREQGEDLGGLSFDETMNIGQRAKQTVLSTLGRQPFDVWTQWEPVYDSRRFYAYVRVSDGDSTEFLHEHLVREGLARIHTRGADVPGGKRFPAQKRALQSLESQARARGAGAWGMGR